MNDLISILDNAALQGLSYGIAVLGIAIAFRGLRYPDLTADGSFLIGSCVFSALITAGVHWFWATWVGIFFGGIAGGCTALIHTKFGVNKLLSGILTSMICYSIAFRVLSGKSTVSIPEKTTFFQYGASLDNMTGSTLSSLNMGSILICTLVAIIAATIIFCLMKSELGLFLRATGENPTFIERLGRKPHNYQVIGLMISNAIISLSGIIVTSRQGFANVNMGFGIIITLVAALVIGEEISKHLKFNPASKLTSRVISPFIGSFIYFLLYILILRASIRNWIPINVQPTDLKMFSALLVVIVVAIRWKTDSQHEEVLPL